MGSEMNKETLERILREAVERQASDVHLTVGIPPHVRIDGRLIPLPYPALTAKDCWHLAKELLDEKAWSKFLDAGEYDGAYSVSGLSRFRLNIFRQRGTVSLALRVIPFRIPSLDELGLPEVTRHLIKRSHGLLLVTGPTGSGKSTTLAAMVDELNRTVSRHIITLEDPIEYLHPHRKSIVVQREVGLDTKTFAAGLRAALREDPDVILVGEMRDTDTVATALTAAETGHLVLATLHTPDAAQAIERMINVFPPGQQDQIRFQIASALIAVYAQRLLPRRDGKGRVAAVEVLVNNPAVANMIRTEKVHHLHTAMQTGTEYGMRTMEQDLDRLMAAGTIRREDGEALKMEWRKLTKWK